jgi:hypothetical protein
MPKYIPPNQIDASVVNSLNIDLGYNAAATATDPA